VAENSESRMASRHVANADDSIVLKPSTAQIVLAAADGQIEFRHDGETVGTVYLESPMRFEGDPEAALNVLSEVLKPY